MRFKNCAALILALMLVCSLTGCFLFAKDGDEKSSPSSSDGSDTQGEEEENPEYPVSAGGATLDSRPGIVVSLSPSLTEKIFDLELSDRLEGVSDYCDYPNGADNLTKCGTAQLPDLDAIGQISPHLLLTETALAENDLAELHQMGVAVAVLPRADSVAELMENYGAIAELFEGKRTGAALGEKFREKFEVKLDSIERGADSERKSVLYLRLLSFTVATGDTIEHELMELAGLDNIAKDYSEWNYPEDDANSASGRDSFASLAIIYCDKRSVTIKMLEQSAFYKGLDVVLKDRYLYINMDAFERQSMRMLDELERMARYARGEIPGSKEEADAAAAAEAAEAES